MGDDSVGVLGWPLHRHRARQPGRLAPEDEATASALDEPRNGHRGVEPSEDRDHPDGPDAEPVPVSAGTQVVQDAPAPTPAQLRVDFGAHLEANYRGWSPSSTRSRSIRPRPTRRCRTPTRGPGAPGPRSAARPIPSAGCAAWPCAPPSAAGDGCGCGRRPPVGPGPDTPHRGHAHGAARAARRRAAVRGAVPHGGRAGRGDRRRRRGLGGHHRGPARAGAEGRERRSHRPRGVRRDLDPGLGDLDVGWDAGWQDEPVSDPFGHAVAADGYDGWTPDREDPRRPADVEEDQR